jgi:hypothetical protein
MRCRQLAAAHDRCLQGAGKARYLLRTVFHIPPQIDLDCGGSDSALLLLQPVGEIGNCGKIKQRFAQSFELLILEEPNSL